MEQEEFNKAIGLFTQQPEGFNPNDHNRRGGKSDVEKCCNCFYNEHGQVGYGGPSLSCTHPDVCKEPNLNLSPAKIRDCGLKHSDMMKEEFDYLKDKSVEDIGYDGYGNRLISLCDDNEFNEQLGGFPKWCPLPENMRIAHVYFSVDKSEDLDSIIGKGYTKSKEMENMEHNYDDIKKFDRIREFVITPKNDSEYNVILIGEIYE